MNCKDGTTRQVISTPEKVDEFLRKRRNNCSVGLIGSLTGLGGIIGGALSYLSKEKSPVAVAMAAFLGGIMGFFSAACIGESRNYKLDQKFIEANTQKGVN